MNKNSHKQINYNKIKEITQNPDENTALFLNRLMEAMIKYTNLNPTSQESHIFLQLHFTSQSAPDIQRKLQKLEEGFQTPQQILINTAFKDFNNGDEEVKQLRDKNTHKKYQMLATILQNQNQTPHTTPKTHPRDLANNPPRPDCNAETRDSGQNLALIHVHQQGLVHNGEKGDIGGWTVCRENSVQPQIPNIFPTEDLISVFLLGDRQDLDHKAPATGEPTDPLVTGTVSGNHISFFLATGASRSVLTENAGPLKKASFPIVGADGIPNTPNITPPLYCTLDLSPLHTPSLLFQLVPFQY
jgi:hypothetical protein